MERNFTRQAQDRLWVTDITEHPTFEGKVYCAVVLDAFSRRVVGWSIDASPTAALTTNALAMATGNRSPRPGGTIIHSDHGVQGGFNWSSQHFDLGGVRRGHGGLEFEDQRCSGGSASAVAR
ncbi:DDE-type integrase/transposase/recombinase [Streptomyces mirabilis]|uniref:DDE-type integrase/transposase/recombinase n=1 Tax=Streptomyces mirabilis TaxID=68239 RepID=UPI003805A251